MILGAGVTGLTAGITTGEEIYEAKEIAGGICASYYVDLNNRKNFFRADEASYRFEIGGGHWIFGVDNEIYNFLSHFTKLKGYFRNSLVYLPDFDLFVPYPIQNHLYYLPEKLRKKILSEILDLKNRNIDKNFNTMEEWLLENFGKTLCEIFFFPFHELYTAGLYKKISVQDEFKTPVNYDLIINGAESETPPVGYNVKFFYPEKGLDDLIENLKRKCRINFNKKVKKIDIKKNEVYFEDGEIKKYEKIISTLPLNKMLEITGIDLGEKPPYTSVLVVNIGAKRNDRTPDAHWIYIPKSKSGFHRVGFYSNVDKSFLPKNLNNNVSVYVEKSYKGGKKLLESEINKLCKMIVDELQEWKFIGDIDVIDWNWIEVAYTFQYSGSNWRENALELLNKNNIIQIGRYGKWKFQGIAESIKDGLRIKK